jgi:hypothetical protein
MIKLNFGRLVASGLTAVLFGVAGAQVTKQGNGYLFRMKFSPGKTTRYHMLSSGNMQGQKFTTTMVSTQKVLSAKGGIAKIEMKMSDVKVVVNGKPMSQKMPQGMQSMTVQMDSMGNAAGSSAGMQQTSISLPKSPVAIGSSWKSSATIPMQGQSMTVNATYKFLGIENIGRVRAAKVATTLSGTGQMAMTGAGTNWIDMSDGSLLKSSIMVTVMGIPVTVSVIRK